VVRCPSDARFGGTAQPGIRDNLGIPPSWTNSALAPAAHAAAKRRPLDRTARLAQLEDAFVQAAASWAKRSRISAAALREVGVPASVLKRRAGML